MTANEPTTRAYQIRFDGLNEITGRIERSGWYTEAESANEAARKFWDRVQWGVITRHTDIVADTIEMYGVSCPGAHRNI